MQSYILTYSKHLKRKRLIALSSLHGTCSSLLQDAHKTRDANKPRLVTRTAVGDCWGCPSGSETVGCPSGPETAGCPSGSETVGCRSGSETVGCPSGRAGTGNGHLLMQVVSRKLVYYLYNTKRRAGEDKNKSVYEGCNWLSRRSALRKYQTTCKRHPHSACEWRGQITLHHDLW